MRGSHSASHPNPDKSILEMRVIKNCFKRLSAGQAFYDVALIFSRRVLRCSSACIMFLAVSFPLQTKLLPVALFPFSLAFSACWAQLTLPTHSHLPLKTTHKGASELHSIQSTFLLLRTSKTNNPYCIYVILFLTSLNESASFISYIRSCAAAGNAYDENCRHANINSAVDESDTFHPQQPLLLYVMYFLDCTMTSKLVCTFHSC